MKNLIFMLFVLLISTGFAQHNINPLTYNDFDTLDVNNVQLISSNLGNSDPSRWLSLPDTSYSNVIIYDHGPWLVGKINGDSVLSIIQWSEGWNYSPGPIIDGQAAMLIHPEDSLKYRVYKISKGDDETNPDYAEWPIDFGAPVNQNGDPLVLGDQTLWTAFNSYDSTVILDYNWSGELGTAPLEFHQTVFGRQGNSNDEQDIFSNTVFIEWEIINKGSSSVDSAYFGFWSDIDFADLIDDNLPAVDTTNQIGYCWSSNEIFRGEVPPAVGYVLLYGPVVPSPGNTAIFKGREISNSKNLKLNAFKGIADDSIPPSDTLHRSIISIAEAQNIARGLSINGYPIINPITNSPTTFPYSGDPVSGEGWLYDYPVSAGAGFVFFSGPFTIAPNDTQWAMIAIVPGIGNSNINSITQMRRKADILRSLPYDSLAFGTLSYPITNVEDEGEIIIPKEFSLFQNYPNPFNPTTKIRYTIPSVILSEAKNLVTLKIYDVLGNEIATLVNEEKPAGVYEVDFNGNGLTSGVYFYQLSAGGFIQTKKMILLR